MAPKVATFTPSQRSDSTDTSDKDALGNAALRTCPTLKYLEVYRPEWLYRGCETVVTHLLRSYPALQVLVVRITRHYDTDIHLEEEEGMELYTDYACIGDTPRLRGRQLRRLELDLYEALALYNGRYDFGLLGCPGGAEDYKALVANVLHSAGHKLPRLEWVLIEVRLYGSGSPCRDTRVPPGWTEEEVDICEHVFRHVEESAGRNEDTSVARNMLGSMENPWDYAVLQREVTN
ncbi:hypothetical protein MN608_11927 [Microdochium nivale]|nr:hypothetical protein MN608_11927 [Microdochium nivale]